MQTHIQTLTFSVCQSRERSLQPRGKTEKICVREKKGKNRETKCGGAAEGIPFGFDRRNKSSQLWAGPSKWGQVTLITPEFKVFPAHPSQPGPVASRSMANEI